MKPFTKGILIIGLCGVGGLCLLLLGFYFYPLISSYIPRTVEWKSESVQISGVYYPLPLSEAGKFEIRDGKIHIQGYSLNLKDFFGKWDPDDNEIIRSIPKRYSHIHSINHRWQHQSPGYTFVDSRTGNQFTLMLPNGGAPIQWQCYDFDESSQLLVISAGDWKAGPESYYSFVEIRSKN
jgi:hypothetical protein